MPAKRSTKSRPPAAAVKRIVVPTDFSAAAVSAVDHARGLAGPRTEFVLVHVVLPAAAPDLVYGALIWDQRTMLSAARKALRNWRTEVGLARVKRVKLQVRIGEPYREITTAAQELKADLIVIPTHGRTGLGHYLLGGTAERVVRHASCPVLVIRAK